MCFSVSVGRRRKEERVAVLSRTNWNADPRRVHQRSERIRKTWSLSSSIFSWFLVTFAKSCQITMNKWLVDAVLFKKLLGKEIRIYFMEDFSDLKNDKKPTAMKHDHSFRIIICLIFLNSQEETTEEVALEMDAEEAKAAAALASLPKAEKEPEEEGGDTAGGGSGEEGDETAGDGDDEVENQKAKPKMAANKTKREAAKPGSPAVSDRQSSGGEDGEDDEGEHEALENVGHASMATSLRNQKRTTFGHVRRRLKTVKPETPETLLEEEVEMNLEDIENDLVLFRQMFFPDVVNILLNNNFYQNLDSLWKIQPLMSHFLFDFSFFSSILLLFQQNKTKLPNFRYFNIQFFFCIF